jgi:hypothetical protein
VCAHTLRRPLTTRARRPGTHAKKTVRTHTPPISTTCAHTPRPPLTTRARRPGTHAKNGCAHTPRPSRPRAHTHPGHPSHTPRPPLTHAYRPCARTHSAHSQLPVCRLLCRATSHLFPHSPLVSESKSWTLSTDADLFFPDSLAQFPMEATVDPMLSTELSIALWFSAFSRMSRRELSLPTIPSGSSLTSPLRETRRRTERGASFPGCSREMVGPSKQAT